MKNRTNKTTAILAASAVLAISGIVAPATSNAGHNDGRRSGSSVMRDVKALDYMTDRLHTYMKREIRHGHGDRALLEAVCLLEGQVDDLRNGFENRRHISVLSRMSDTVTISARNVVFRLRRATVCEESTRRLAFAVLDRARFVSDRLAPPVSRATCSIERRGAPVRERWDYTAQAPPRREVVREHRDYKVVAPRRPEPVRERRDYTRRFR